MKLTIVHTTGSRAGAQSSISGKATIRLGRHPDNDLVFDAPDDVSVSAHHAEIRVVDQRARIIDLGSTNGTFVGGKRVQEQDLAPNDLVQFGPQGTGFRVEYAAPTITPVELSVAAQYADTEPPKVAATTTPIPALSTPSPSAPPKAVPAEQIAPEAQSQQSQPESAPTPEPKPEPDSSGQKQYGQRTVGVMIQQALAQAGMEKKTGTSKSTEYFEALVEKKVKKTSSRFKRVLVFSIIAVVVLGSVFGLWMWYNRSVQVVQQVNYGDATGSSIAANNRYAVFMLAGIPRGNPRADLQGFCTGFTVAPDLLATNAHCVLAAQSKFSTVYALMNGVRGSRYLVTQMVRHPGYTPDAISPDVALMRIAARLQQVVTMASATELTQVSPGAPMFLYGFPGRLNKEEAPEATFIKGDIGRITTFDQELGDFGQNTLIQHSAYSTGGTSGSPMFNSAGHVIGVNAGGYVEAGEVLHGYNFGMRIDLIHSMYSLIGAQR